MEIIEINSNGKCISGLLFDKESNSYFLYLLMENGI